MKTTTKPQKYTEEELIKMLRKHHHEKAREEREEIERHGSPDRLPGERGNGR